MSAAKESPRRAAWPVVVAAGVSAALHVGKLAPAIPVLRETLGVSLAEAGFLISMVQLAGMLLGMAVGLAADSLGPRRCMLTGLVLLSLASIAGGFAGSASALLLLRALEGFGFLLAAMPAPSLIRRLVPPERVSRALGWWGCYVPLATASALLLGPLVIHAASWPWWWWTLAVFSLAMAVWLALAVPEDPARGDTPRAPRDGWRARLVDTLRAPGPWFVSAGFAMYSGQWLAVVGFLPALYAQAEVAPGLAAPLTAMVALVNMVGNVGSGRLLARGVAPSRLLFTGFAAMGIAAVVAFTPWPQVPPLLRYAAVLGFSAIGGLIPGTLFSLAVRLAPGERTVSTTVGLMYQCSAIGQFLGPPIVGWVAGRAGGWQWTWCVTGACSVVGVLLASRLPHRS